MAGTVRANSASGDVTIGVAAGIGVWLDLTSISGDTRTDLTMPTGHADQSAAALNLQVRTVSGDIDVHRAPAHAAA
jgi:predicted membrane protein